MLGRLRKARRVAEELEESYTNVSDRAARSLACDVVIAAIDPASGKVWSNAGYAVAGALLVELTKEGRLDVAGEGKKARVTVRDSTPLGDEALDEALLTLATGAFGTKVTTLVNFLPDENHVLERLTEAGLVVAESHRKLGMFTVRRYQPTPSAGRDELVARLRSALLGESVPDERTALLISVLIGVHLKLFVPRSRVGEAYRRSGEILERIGDDERALVAAVRHALSNSDGYSSSV